jgi:choline dehydrogenase-like flavoprotein
MLTARAEMRPSAANAVWLTAERDRSGLYRPAARCVIGADDFQSAEATVRVLGDVLTRTNRGRVRFNNDPLYRNVGGGGHIMGTTRMGSSRSNSVVDRDCRVHGYTNLFVAGSSVFPTGGYANPTFTIVALALRLADHIAERA